MTVVWDIVEPTHLAVDAKFVYWSDSQGTIGRVLIAGGQPEFIADQQGSITGIAVDGENIYWVGRNVMMVPKR